MVAHSQATGANVVVLFPRRRRMPGDDDYRGRMTVYGIVFLATACFVAGGVWLVTAITSIPAHTDCNFSRHRPCHHYENGEPSVRFVGALR